MDFFLFILVNATLFMRPAEIVPELYGWPIYNCIIIANLVVAGPAIIGYLQRNGLTKCPTTTCVLGVLVFIVLSQLARFDTWMAREGFFKFVKIVAYFLLLVAIINTRRRLFWFLGLIVAFTLVLVSLAVLQYHGLIQLDAFSAVLDSGDFDEMTGEAMQVRRLRATGIFSDPNDLSMIVVACLLICTCGLLYPGMGLTRPLLLAPMGLLFYALMLTHSRGGLLALFAGFGVLFYSRYGLWKALVLGAVTAPVVLVVVGGRQSGIGAAITGGTGATRAEHWADGLIALKGSPIFGVGYGLYEDYAGGHVAHNSFVHAFTELGFFGGMMFLGVFAGVGYSLYQLNRVKAQVRDPAIRHLVPFMLAILASFCVSMMSLSRGYIIPTYMVAGLGVVTTSLASPGTSVRPLQFDARWVTYLAMGSVGMIAFIYFYIKVLYRM